MNCQPHRVSYSLSTTIADQATLDAAVTMVSVGTGQHLPELHSYLGAELLLPRNMPLQLEGQEYYPTFTTDGVYPAPYHHHQLDHNDSGISLLLPKLQVPMLSYDERGQYASFYPPERAYLVDTHSPPEEYEGPSSEEGGNSPGGASGSVYSSYTAQSHPWDARQPQPVGWEDRAEYSYTNQSHQHDPSYESYQHHYSDDRERSHCFPPRDLSRAESPFRQHQYQPQEFHPLPYPVYGVSHGYAPQEENSQAAQRFVHPALIGGGGEYSASYEPESNHEQFQPLRSATPTRKRGRAASSGYPTSKRVKLEERGDDDEYVGDSFVGRRRSTRKKKPVLESDDEYAGSDEDLSPLSRSSSSFSDEPRRQNRRKAVYQPYTDHPVPVPNLTKKSRGRKVPETFTPPSTDETVASAIHAIPGTEAAKGRTFQCETCSKTFIRGEHLKRHIRSIHTNDKPHPCTHRGCGKSFSRKDNLNQHQKLHA